MPETINETELVSKLRQGDTDAFKILYEKYAPRLKAFSFRFNFTLEESEDLVQETFIRIWEKRLTIIPTSSFNTFLITIAKHLIYNQLRHSVYKKNYSKEILYASGKDLTLGNERDLQQLIEKSIKQLPDKCRRVYQKSRIEGQSNSEIAAEMNISKSTVENQLNKALKRLRQSMLSAGYGTSPIFLLLVGLHNY